MTSPDHQADGRTLIAAVVFADLVGYSKKSVTEQMSAKEAFRQLVQGVLAPVAPGVRVVLDTGDGAAVAFTADPEHALYCALRLLCDVRAASPGALLRPEDIRIGVNLGPVRRAVDVNGRPNLVGEGMNSAERVMSFSPPGEATASRSFRDAVTCLDESYRHLFEPMGGHADKHGREHEVFRIAPTTQALHAAIASLAPAAGGGTEAGEDDQVARASPVSRRRRVAIVLASATIAGAGVLAWSLWAPAPTPPELHESAAPPTAAAEKPIGAPFNEVPATVLPLPVQHAPDSQPVAAQETPSPDSQKSAVSENPEVKISTSPKTTTRPAPARAPKSARQAGDPATSQRCNALVQRGALERLSPSEQEELRTSCP